MKLNKRQKGQLDDLLEQTIAPAIVEDLNIVDNKRWNEAIEYLVSKLKDSLR